MRLEGKIIKKEAVIQLLKKLSQDYLVIAPLKGCGGDIIFQELPISTETFVSKNSISLIQKYKNTLLPPKVFLFPQAQYLFGYQQSGENTDKENPWQLKAEIDSTRRLIFGIRTCDLKAVSLLDHFFREELPDIYYLSRRENTSFVNIGCLEPYPHCFCASTDSGPFLKVGFDLQFTDLNDRYYVEVGSAQGEAIITQGNEFFRDPLPQETLEKDQCRERVEERFRKVREDISAAIVNVTEGKVKESFWEELANRCLSCGGCTYVCPTCTCFNTAEIFFSPTKGKRRMFWDSCIFAGFTREASGYNPRAQLKDRFKRRYYHKLGYDYSLKNGMLGCVGCGRCTLSCPADIDMWETIKHLLKGG